jgi:exopolysaccharide biosynthesis polyprenyl glycosylphosphotransferase
MLHRHVDSAHMATTEETEGRRPRERVVPTARGFSLRRRTGRWRDALRRRYLAAADVAAVLLAGAASGVSLPVMLATLPVWILLAKLHGLYDRDHRVMRHLTSDELGSLIAWAATGSLSVLGFAGLVSEEQLAAGDGVQLVLALALIAPAMRATARWVWRCSVSPEQVLVVGSGRLARSTRRKLEIFGDMHQRLVPVTVEPPDVADPAQARATLDRVLAVHPLDRVVVAAETLEEPVVVALVIACRERVLKLGFVPPAPAAFASTARLGRLGELPVVDSLTWDPSRSTMTIKRCADVAVAAIGLVLAAPLMVAIAVVIRLTSPGPALFRQQRAGRDGAPFSMWKFRTMCVDAERRLEDLVVLEELAEPVFKLPDDPRVTAVGRFLRRTSLDELPQLVNVLLGQMSLVGPRPEQVELVARYSEGERARLAVKPGMTGPMQVLGRGRLSLEERVALERDYVETISLTGDVRILLRTIGSVLGGRGAT